LTTTIQSGELNQNVHIERSNRTYQDELLDLYQLRKRAKVRVATYWWMIKYNEQRPLEALKDLTPAENR
jgi:putative transposase